MIWRTVREAQPGWVGSGPRIPFQPYLKERQAARGEAPGLPGKGSIWHEIGMKLALFDRKKGSILTGKKSKP